MLRLGRLRGDDETFEGDDPLPHLPAPHLVRGMLGFLLRVEEALGDLALARNSHDEVTVHIAADLVSSYAGVQKDGAEGTLPRRPGRPGRPRGLRGRAAARGLLPLSAQGSDMERRG
jgi:hypothetical protein